MTADLEALAARGRAEHPEVGVYSPAFLEHLERHAGDGTPAYMSPEQLAGRDIDARTDQFSFAVAMWEALYGRRPFGEGARSYVDLRDAMALGPVRGDRSGAPAWLEPVLRRALSLEPRDRYPSMRALAEALDGPEAAAKPLLDKLVSTLVAMLVLSIGVLAGVAAIAILESGKPEDEPFTSYALAYALWIFFGWPCLSVLVAPVAAIAVAQRRRWGYFVVAFYALASLPTVLGTPFAVFAAYVLSRRSVRAAFGHRARSTASERSPDATERLTESFASD